MVNSSYCSTVGMGSNSNNSNDEALRRMYKLINGFLARSDSAPFREPVDWRGLELWDYPKIIKKMMDLGTVKRKLDRGQYNSAHECAEDIRLIWKNCMTYNADGSDFFLLAQNFSRKFEDRYKKIRQDCDTGDNEKGADASKNSSSGSNNAPSLEDRVKFSANIFKLNGSQLGHVMQQIDVRCPQALEKPAGTSNGTLHSMTNESTNQITEDDVEINVDAIDPRTFADLDNFLNECLAKSTLGASSANDSNNKKASKRKR